MGVAKVTVQASIVPLAREQVTQAPKTTNAPSVSRRRPSLLDSGHDICQNPAPAQRGRALRSRTIACSIAAASRRSGWRPPASHARL